MALANGSNSIAKVKSFSARVLSEHKYVALGVLLVSITTGDCQARRLYRGINQTQHSNPNDACAYEGMHVGT